MSSSNVTPFETILKLCQQAAPGAWYPAEFATSLGIDDGRFRGPLEELGMAGLIEPTAWHAERGQGYRLTRAGAEIVNSPGLLEELRAGRGRSEESPRPKSAARRPSQANAKRPWVTYAILAATIGVFLLGMSIANGGNWGQMNVRVFFIGGNAHARHVTGALSAADLDAGQWWRLLATIFVHRDLFHILINMSTFLGFARRAEDLWGCWRFALIYLISGVAYACVSLWQDPSTHPIGSAGSIFGAMLSVGVWLFMNRAALPREQVNQGIRQIGMAFAWFMGWLFLMAWLSGLEFRWLGYVAGAVAGLITAVLLNQQKYMTSPVRWLFLLLLPLVPIASVALVLQARNTKPEWRDAVAVQRKQHDEQQRAAAEKKKDNDEKPERERFNKEFLPTVLKASDFIEKQWSAVSDVCDEDPKKRDADDLKKAKRTVAEAQQATDAALKAVADFGQPQVDLVERAVIAAKNYLNDQHKLLEMTERCLNANAALPDKDTQELEEQAKQTQKTWKNFDSKLK
jgi:rhomboid protease GluP